MPRSRYQQRLNTCSVLLLALLLLILVSGQWMLSRRPPRPPILPTATATPLFISREALAGLPTHTPYLIFTPLPSPTATRTHTPTPIPTRTPTRTPTATATPAPTRSAQIAIELVNVRSGPDPAYDVTVILGQGEQVTVRGQNAARDWYFVEMTNGDTGWIFAELLAGVADPGVLAVLTPPPSPTPTLTPATISGAARGVASAAPLPVAAADSGQRLLLANYFAWYDLGSWDACNISAGDSPLQRYHSDDPAAIARHVQQARGAGVDGFTLQWASPGDRTDRNFAALLAQSAGTDFRSTVIFLRHIWPGASYANTIEALRYLLAQYAGHPHFLRLQDRPVLFITDLGRVPRAGGESAQQAWAAIRAQVDPNKAAWWIAEGLDASYLSVFDGLWVYKVSHAAYPNDYAKATRWAGSVSGWEQRTGETKLWVGTLMPGWDDTRAGCRADIRAPSPPFARDRAGGDFYRATFAAAVASAPDLLWIHSFNEWVEGSYIEPSAFYGDAYLTLTRELAAQYKNR